MMAQTHPDKNTLLHNFAKTFAGYLKSIESSNKLALFDDTLHHFNKVMTYSAPSELGSIFKEFNIFTLHTIKIFVSEIRSLANNSDSTKAASSILFYMVPSDQYSRGWYLIKSIDFLVASGSKNVIDILCKELLPSTIVKVFYLFFDLPEAHHAAETSLRLLYDSLVMMMVTMCSFTEVSDELIQKDAIFCLFDSSSSNCFPSNLIWRDATFTFLCTIVGKALSQPISTYIHSKGCISHYVENLYKFHSNLSEKTLLLCNLIDLLRCSSEHTGILIDDFFNSNGSKLISSCLKSASQTGMDQLLTVLAGLITSGDKTVKLELPELPIRYNYKLDQDISRSTGTVRVPQAYLILENCLYESDDKLFVSILETVLNLLCGERMNYFIIEKICPLSKIYEHASERKSEEIQAILYKIVEYVLKELNYIPAKELAVLNLQIARFMENENFQLLDNLIAFLIKILGLNTVLKDGYRELHIIPRVMDVFKFAYRSKVNQILKISLEFLIASTKGASDNAQIIIECIDMHIVKSILTSKNSTKQQEDLKAQMLKFLNILLQLAKNEQMFSTLLQFMFSDPNCIPFCTIILELFASVLSDNHKVRIMFRKSGGCICLMTLLLNLEGRLFSNSAEVSQFLPNHMSLFLYISLIFQVLMVSMRYEPSNARYFLAEVQPFIINSILRSFGCFSTHKKIDIRSSIWKKVVPINETEKLSAIHHLFMTNDEIFRSAVPNALDEFMTMPQTTFAVVYVLKQMFDLVFDNDRTTKKIIWANDEWLTTPENIENFPLFSPKTLILVHPTALLSILYLLPSIRPTSQKEVQNEESDVDKWSAITQLYMSLILRTILRSERNQQIMCKYDMPKAIMDVGLNLFTIESGHPLLSSFNYMLERLSCQSLRPAELRRFLRLNQPLCCVNLVDDEKENGSIGGPVPLNRIKALVSMLTPRNHAITNPPAFVEFDLSTEGFASLLIPSLITSSPKSSTNNDLAEGSFFKNGFTFLVWFSIDEYLNSKTNALPVTLISIVRNVDASVEGQQLSRSSNIENCITFFEVKLNMATRVLTVSLAEHSILENSNFKLPVEQSIRLSLPESLFGPKQWTHLAIVADRTTHSKSQANIEIILNDYCLHSHILTAPTFGLLQTHPQKFHAFIGTPPFFRRVTTLHWKIASMMFIDTPISSKINSRIFSLGAEYCGNFQTAAANSLALLDEGKIILNLNPKACCETNALTLHSMIGKADCDLVVSLLGISSNDVSTPLRVLWNMSPSGYQNKSFGAIMIGYLGMHSFVPIPVSALFHSVGGLSPLIGLVAMSTDSQGLYASLKVLVSAITTDTHLANSLQLTRGYQMLAILLEEKSNLVNSHILHMVLTLVGTFDGSKESTVIPNVQTFDDLLCDLDVWRNAPEDILKLLLEHFYDLIIDNNQNLAKIRASNLFCRVLVFLFENNSLIIIRSDTVFRIIQAIIQPPCDGTLLLRMVQTISATVDFENDENNYPFHIAELEQLLLGANAENESSKSRDVYPIYVRNRLLNIVYTALANSSGSVNSNFAELIVNTAGFGWILTVCSPPKIHTGTTYLALKILTHLLEHPTLLEKFRDGTANGGWLNETDSVIRNRAAVLLGFSVAIGVGAIGSKVDVNPELSNCSGFAVLEQIACANADKPFIYLIFLAILFQRWRANIQTVENFSINSIWSQVFDLEENSPVDDAINESNLCSDAVVPILSLVRSSYNYNFSDGEKIESGHWSSENPLIILQLFTFLYQNSAPFFSICQTETFIISSFMTLVPQLHKNQIQRTLDGMESGQYYDNKNRCRRQIIELLTNCILNDLCLPHHSQQSDCLFEALIEFLETDNNAIVQASSSAFTELIESCLDQLVTSKIFFVNSVVSPVPPSIRSHLNPTSEGTTLNVIAFLSRVCDTLWNCIYRGNGLKILKCFLKLLSESYSTNKASARINSTSDHVSSMFRIILYLLSRPIDSVDSQMAILDTLAEILRNQHILLNPKIEIDSIFFGAFAHLIFMLSDKAPDYSDDEINRQLERGSAQVLVCIQSVWGILWQQKKTLLKSLFKREVDLDLHTARISCDEQANQMWLKFVDKQTDAFSSVSTFQRAASTISKGVELQSKITAATKNSIQRFAGKQFALLTMGTSSTTRENHSILPYGRLTIDKDGFFIWARVHLSLVKEFIRNNCQRYHEWHQHTRKWCINQWHTMETELTRECGLWGPEFGSELDKFELDTTEGSGLFRIRKLLIPNPKFYYRYPYRPALDAPEARALRSKVAISRDSKLYYERMKKCRPLAVDERIINFTNPIHQVSDPHDAIEELNLSLIKRVVNSNLEKIKNETRTEVEKTEADEDESDQEPVNDNSETQSPKPTQDGQGLAATDTDISPDPTSPIKTFGPGNQSLLRVLEQGEQLHSMFRCARIQGLDTMEGLLLFGSYNFYIIDGFTLLKTKEIRDLDFLPDQYHDPIIPYASMGNKSRQVRIDRQCIKFNYDELKEIYKRRYLLQPIALEVFACDGRNYLLAFPRKIRDRVYQKITAASKILTSTDGSIFEQKKSSEITASHLKNSLIGQQSITQRWVRAELSNFEYLIQLNTLAGRSYNDLSQYPIFPWIISDYTSNELDLTNPLTFRDLSKPMGAQSDERLSHFLKRYHEWDPAEDTPAYMYGTHYSSAMIVLSYLVRLEPFTQQFLNLQGGHFDLADRMFNSIQDAYLSARQNNMADVKELIPEFFYLPQMFKNENNFDLGIKQSGVQLHDVQLPLWAHDDPYEFVRQHRQALESDYVSEHLHEWIDLIFGYKQSGEPARLANNVFHHLFYEENVNFDSIEDPLTRNATLGFINNFGQIPTQLFKKPHPQRRITHNTSIGIVSVVPGIVTPRRFYHCLETLKVTPRPVKELRTAVGDIVVNNKNQVVVLEQNKVFLPPISYLAWGFYDQSVRIGNVGSDKSTCILEMNGYGTITCMTTVGGHIYMGLTTGVVRVYLLAARAQTGISARQQRSCTLSLKNSLYAHTDAITALASCSFHNILVSGGRDHIVIVWHLTQHTFIRQLRGHPGPITAAAINDSNGDIATASNSLLFLWTLNGILLAVVSTDESSIPSVRRGSSSSMITCIAFSTDNDWDPQNVILCGTSDGFVKIYSSERKQNKEWLHFSEDSKRIKKNDDSQTIKVHLVRRQHIHNSRLNSKLLNQSSLDFSKCQSSFFSHSPLDDSHQNYDTISSRGEDSEEENSINGGMETCRILKLRHQLGEHTAFLQENVNPAPVTSIRVTKDHKALLIGDGIGRVWMWNEP